jgi:hypothetical protein
MQFGDENQPQCTAKSKRSGKQCKNPPMSGMRVCRMHGGKSLKGYESPRFVHGRLSKHLPDRMIEDALAASNDLQLGSLMEEIVVTNARITDLLKRVDSGESGSMWVQLQEASKELRKAQRLRDTDAISYWQDEMISLVSEGNSDYAAWSEIHENIERIAKLYAAERKRAVELNLVIRSDRALTLFATLLGIVKTAIRDKVPEEYRAAVNNQISFEAKKILEFRGSNPT